MTIRIPTQGMGLFSLIWLGQVVSFVGSAMTSFALGVKVFQDSGSVTSFALIGLSSALAILIFSPLAGIVADRYDRRLVLITAQLASVLSNAILLRLIVTDRLVPAHIYPLVAVGAIFSSFLWPTFSAAVTNIVSKADFARASGMLQMGASLSAISGPLFAGFLLEPIGLAGIVRLNITSFLVAAGILLLVRIPRPTTQGENPASTAGKATGPSADPESSALEGKRPMPAPAAHGYTSGWTFIRSHPGLFRLLMTFAALNFATGMVQVLITPMVLSFSSARVMGLVASIASSGALVGGIVMSVWGGPKRRIPLIYAVAALQGLLLFMGGLQANATLITASAFFFMLGFPIIAGASQSLWQSKTPPDIQGRVFAYRRMVAGSSIPIAQAVAGPLADHVFEPLMARGGLLAVPVGTFIGVGPGRGIGLMCLVLGVGLTIGGLVMGRSRAIREVETSIPDVIGDGPPPPPTTDRGDRAATTALAPRPALALLAVLVALAIGATHLAMRPPPAQGDETPADAFSATRALRHTAAISTEPHPTGSRAQAAAGRYLFGQFEALGYEVEMQRVDNALDSTLIASMISVENIVARLPGSAEEDRRRTVLLVAHYDSVPSGPGAADNGAGVGALLETARALRAGPPLPNDVVFLLSDAEEAGLHGAHAFVRQHPWARNVALTINVDARGNRGAAYVFETGDDNGWWIPRFADAVPNAAANSVMSAVYDLLPNRTDFDVFRAAGWAGFNIAPIGGLAHYHSQRDSVEFVDPSMVQHQGAYTLTLARTAAALDLSAPPETRRGPNRTYFSVLGLRVVHYGTWFAWLSALLAVGGFGWLVFDGLRRRSLTPFGLAQGFLSAFAIMISVPIAITLAWMVVRDAGGVPVLMGSTEGAPLFMVAFAALATAAAVLLQRFFRLSVGLLDMLVGGLGWWLILIVLTSGIALPAVTNFLFVWPFLGALGGVAYLLRKPPHEWRSGRTALVFAVSAVPALALFSPFIATGYVALQGQFELGGAAIVPLVLLLVLLTAHLEAVSAGRRWLIPALCLGVSMAFLGLALTRSNHADKHTMNSAIYVWDVEEDTHRWHSYDPKPTPWSRQLGFTPNNTGTSFRRVFPLIGPTLVADAPIVPLVEPTATLLDSSVRGGVRQYELTLEASPGAGGRLISFEPSAAVISVQIDDKVMSMAPPTRLIARLPVRPVETLKLRVRGDQPLHMIVNEQIPGFPNGVDVRPRGAHDLTRPLLSIVRSDVTFVRSTFELSPAAFAAAERGAAAAERGAAAAERGAADTETGAVGAAPLSADHLDQDPSQHATPRGSRSAP